MNTHFKTRASSVLLHSLISFLPSHRITLLLDCVYHSLASCEAMWCLEGSSGASLPRSLPWWQADPKMAPASWYLISFAWVKTGPNDSLLFWREHSNNDGMSPPGLGCRKTVATILLIFFMLFLLLGLLKARYHVLNFPVERSTKLGKNGAKKNWERPSIQWAQGPVWKWVPLQLSLEMTWSLADTLIEILGETLSQREDPAKPHLDFWPTKIVRSILLF